MKKIHQTPSEVYASIYVISLLFLNLFVLLGCSKEAGLADSNGGNQEQENPTVPSPDTPDQNATNIDVNNDGTLNILILGSSKSINNATNPFRISELNNELNNIFIADPSVSLNVKIATQDIFTSKEILVGLGGNGTEYSYTHFRHSLTQFYHWPEGKTARLNNLSGQGDTDWDYVIITADPYIVENVPGYFALGVNKIASKIEEGSAKTLLVMMWPNSASSSIKHYEEFTYRTATGARVPVQVVPAGLAWEALPSAKKDNSSSGYPSPNGAYVTAAAIYSQITNKSAIQSDYTYDDEIANVAMNTVTAAASGDHFTGKPSFSSPFQTCNIMDAILNYNHTGTSTERGILQGLTWVVGKAGKQLVLNGDPPINFNYGRANTNFEPDKRYKLDPAKFDFSVGFPMQDHSNHGETSMLYGLDYRGFQNENGTDLGTALFMVRNSELPLGRAIPIRTLWAEIKEAMPSQSAYSDSWHLNEVLNKAIGGFLYTLLTNDCAVGPEPSDQNSLDWKNWKAHKIGYETAWTLMYYEAIPPGCYE